MLQCNFLQSLIIHTVQTTNQTVSIPNLEPCLRYWVRVSAVLCDASVNSDPKRIDLRKEEDFTFLIRLEERGECSDWVLQGSVLLDVQGEVSSQLSCKSCARLMMLWAAALTTPMQCTGK